MNKLKLSYIIPAFNVESFLKQCVESLYCQDIFIDEFEVIIINDGSMDSTMVIAEKLKSKYNNIILINQENQGVSAARNTGLEKATGMFICFVDGDDKLAPSTIKILLDKAITHDLEIIRGNYTRFSSDEEIITKEGTTQFVVKEGEDCWDIYSKKDCGVYLNIYKTDFLKRNQLKFMKGISMGEDLLFTTSCYNCLKHSGYLDLTFYLYRYNINSCLHTINIKKLSDCAIVLKKLGDISDNSTAKSKYFLNIIIAQHTSNILWYLSHHKCIFEKRNELIPLLKECVRHNHFGHDIKSSIIHYFLINHPYFYIWLRYHTARKKYE
ncbi:MAG: glycosyltransferase [Bacteroidaceae bacterium]|nr:glycosyltransferase [Bacteroidaceae bacterium]